MQVGGAVVFDQEQLAARWGGDDRAVQPARRQDFVEDEQQRDVVHAIQHDAVGAAFQSVEFALVFAFAQVFDGAGAQQVGVGVAHRFGFFRREVAQAGIAFVGVADKEVGKVGLHDHQVFQFFVRLTCIDAFLQVLQPARAFDLRQDVFRVVRRCLLHVVFADALEFEGDEFFAFFRVLVVVLVEALHREGERLRQVDVQQGQLRLAFV